MNVIQFIGSFHQGGSERQAVQLTKLLSEDKRVNVFAATLNKEGILLDEIEKLNLPEIAEFKLTSFYDANFLKQLKSCVRFLKENKIDIVHTHDFYTNVFGIAAARIAGVKLKIASKRETDGMRSRSQVFLERQVFKLSGAIVANSVAVKNHLIKSGISAEKINVIYNGLDLERLQPKISGRKEICEILGLPTDEKIKFITLVANLRHAVKNQPMFLRAAQKVSAKSPNAHFILAGEGEMQNGLERQAADLKIEKKVHFIGRCTQVPELLRISYACVLTSFFEGFSNSILEYMSAAKPVVATNVGGASEAIIENETGFLVESDDDEKLADRLLELIANEEKARIFGENGKKKVLENFSLQAQLENTLDLYRRNFNE